MGFFLFVPPRTLCSPQLQSTCHYIVNHYVKILHVPLGVANNMHPVSWGGGHKRKRSAKCYNLGERTTLTFASKLVCSKCTISDVMMISSLRDNLLCRSPRWEIPTFLTFKTDENRRILRFETDENRRFLRLKPTKTDDSDVWIPTKTDQNDEKNVRALIGFGKVKPTKIDDFLCFIPTKFSTGVS